MKRWNPILGYEGIYEVSSCGEIRSIPRPKTKGGNIVQNTRNGYKRAILSKGGVPKAVSVHREVAKAFLSNDDGFEVVHHIDGVRDNNCVDNLEWTTQAQNLQYNNGTAGILQISKCGVNIFFWESAFKAKKDKGFDDSCIIKCCKGLRNSHKGYRWEYAYK